MIKTTPPSKIALKIIRRLNLACRKGYIPARGDRSKPITSSWVVPHLLYAQILNNRQSYHVQLAALRKSGFEDPFEITPKIKEHAEKIVKKFGERTELGKAAVLFQSIIPSSRKFMVGESLHDGLSIEEGGLDIRRSKDPNARIRQLYGSVLPKALLAAPAALRSAACLEYSFLLNVLLRSLGIKARLEGDAEHTYVVALLDGEGYKIDTVNLEFKLAVFRSIETDHKYAAVHYANKGYALMSQGEKDEALQSYYLALEIDPECAQAWNNLGVYHKREGNPKLAMEYFDKAIAIDRSYARAWRNKADILLEEEKIEEARAALRMVIKNNPLLLNSDKYQNLVRDLDSELIP